MKWLKQILMDIIFLDMGGWVVFIYASRLGFISVRTAVRVVFVLLAIPLACALFLGLIHRNKSDKRNG